jgi:hypothetical protein
MEHHFGTFKPDDRGAHDITQEHTGPHGAVDPILICLRLAGRSVSREEIERALRLRGNADA